MRQQARDIQYTVRGVPPEVDAALRRRARERGLSLNQVILEELSLVTVGAAVRADFSDLVGKWTADPEFDRVIRSQRRIDAEKWK